MKVNHLHLMVPSVPAPWLFRKVFELRKVSGNAGLTVLLDDGFVLTLMKLNRGPQDLPRKFPCRVLPR